MKRLTRTTEDRKLAGVCGGLGEYFNIDPTLVRIIAAILFIPFSALVAILYIAAIFLVPNDTEADQA
ncbi:PspC domain-containing protein [Alkalicoccus halolimnae]|uniref:PspC domain-containing protein n=1 Tax=Alkalicoccus halolimnae TaxID=1667239 RepID=A0A5C7F2G1_9BACI|nr:PspC domain-containing protein [Alkalicoccus halolimnae]TXF84335.1 PspC domain-containing protein [Alkalicoccus halolimnae]